MCLAYILNFMQPQNLNIFFPYGSCLCAYTKEGKKVRQLTVQLKQKNAVKTCQAVGLGV